MNRIGLGILYWGKREGQVQFQSSQLMNQSSYWASLWLKVNFKGSQTCPGAQRIKAASAAE